MAHGGIKIAAEKKIRFANFPGGLLTHGGI